MVLRRWYVPALLAALSLVSCNAGMRGASTGTGFGGAQDAGYFRAILASGGVPQADDITYEGFLAEHDFPLPAPGCADLLCMHGIVGVGPTVEPGHLTLLQLGLNSPDDPASFTPTFRNLALVIDKSGSMGGSNIKYAREGLLKLVDQLTSSDVVSLTVYDSGARVVRGAALLTDPEALKAQIRLITAGGSTNLHAGMMLGYEQAQIGYEHQAVNRVILLTDGMANTGVTDPDQIVADSKAYNDEGIGITTIGVGTSYNQDLMLALARNGGGNNYFLDDPLRLQEVFVDELQSLYTLLARDLHVEVEPGAAFDTSAVYGAGTSALQPDGSVTIDVPSVFYSVARQGVLLVALEPTGQGPGPHPLAEIRYEYVRNDTGALEGGVATPTYPGKVPYDPGDEHYGGSPARKALVVLEIVRGFKRASTLYHDPQVGWTDAVATLQDLERFVNTHQNALQDPEIDEDLTLIARFIANATP